MAKAPPPSRRRFIKRCLVAGSSVALGASVVDGLVLSPAPMGLRVGYRNDGPSSLWRWSREAAWYTKNISDSSAQIQCELCPHKCILGERDRGLCRVRVVYQGKLHTLAYGNPCAVHIDPIEKKPLSHFLPGTPILSIATAGCNLRCLNCQNWEISQAKPEETRNYDLMPDALVDTTTAKKIPSIAYTYSEPLVFYEYVEDSAQLAREHSLRNVLVTAGYINQKPLARLSQVIDAANVDLKGFTEYFYRKVANGRLAPVLDSLVTMKSCGVWIEITHLIVPTLSDDTKHIRDLSKWIVQHLGPDIPLHLSRFHPAHQLRLLPATPLDTMIRAYKIARDAGLHYVYLGNTPQINGLDTACPSCDEVVIKRRGYRVLKNDLVDGKCSCGSEVAGVWS
jgi:pyruvate formate lyase activating enzyme